MGWRGRVDDCKCFKAQLGNFGDCIYQTKKVLYSYFFKLKLTKVHINAFLVVEV